MRDVRLGGFLGKEAKDDKPKQALFWRSGKTVDALAGNLAGMKALLEASKLAGALPADQAWIGKEALFEFGNAANAAAAADGPIADVLADPERRGKLAYFGLVTSSLSEHLRHADVRRARPDRRLLLARRRLTMRQASSSTAGISSRRRA